MASPELAVVPEQSGLCVRVHGNWSVETLEAMAKTGRAFALPAGSGEIASILDGSHLEHLDPTGAYRLMSVLQASGLDVAQLQLRHFSPASRQVWQLVRESAQKIQAPEQVPKLGWVAGIGKDALIAWEHVQGFLLFLGQLSIEFFTLLKRPAGFRLKEFVVQIEAVFVYAIPISAMMIFLLGVVFAYLMGVQAQKFGANIFVVDGVTAAVLRELSPVIVAILVAGRTGAAITAQLGTMKVNEEIDALSVLGLSPIAVLVIPRILALIIALPLLVFIGDVTGILGGMLIAKTQLGLEYGQFWERLESVIKMSTLLVGIGKAPVFAVFIGMIACRMGMTVARDARSVGLHTTSTVVQSIVSVIVLNAIFAVIFTRLDI